MKTDDRRVAAADQSHGGAQFTRTRRAIAQPAGDCAATDESGGDGERESRADDFVHPGIVE